MKRRVHILLASLTCGLLATSVMAVDPASRAGRPTPIDNTIGSTPLTADVEGGDTEPYLGVNVFTIDHFKVWDVDDVPVSLSVTLKDQFDPPALPAVSFNLDLIDHFSNAVDKNGGGILDPNAHLVWYRIENPQKQPARTLRIENQFGNKQYLIIRTARYLLVPAEKVGGGGAPGPLDHYKCYNVTRALAVNATVNLVDQFNTESVTVRKAKWFCNPVDKNGEGIINVEDHLVFYDIVPQTPFSTSVTAVDQFGSHPLNVTGSLYLGVPSKKFEVDVPAVSEWGLATLLVLVLVAATIALRRRAALA